MSLICINCFVLNLLCFCRALEIPSNFIKVAVELLFVYWTGLITFPCLIIVHAINLEEFSKGSTKKALQKGPFSIFMNKDPNNTQDCEGARTQSGMFCLHKDY
jgi:hypothetical protein